MTKLIFVEGNVASGKSSALDYLRNVFSDQISFLEEPVDDWQKVNSSDKGSEKLNLLDHFYTDFTKYGFCFQTYAFLTRMKKLLEVLKSDHKPIILCERSIFTDREIFLEMLYENGSVNPMERAVYHNLWDFWIDLMKPYFKDVQIEFLYLSCKAEKAFEHLQIRSRSEESAVSLDYLTDLENKHQELYNGKNERLNKLINTLLDQSQSKVVNIKMIENDGSREEYLAKLHEWLLNSL